MICTTQLRTVRRFFAYAQFLFTLTVLIASLYAVNVGAQDAPAPLVTTATQNQGGDQVAPTTALAPSAIPTTQPQAQVPALAQPSVQLQSAVTPETAPAQQPQVFTAPARPAWFAEHDNAVKQARNGDTKDALITLRKLYQAHGDDKSIVRDYLAVLSWDGSHDQQVVTLYKSLPGDTHDYVLEAVGKAYRNLHQPEDARAIYLQGLRVNPASDVYAAGLIHSTTEAGYIEEAMKSSDENIHRYGPRIEVLLAAGNAADQFDQADAAVRYYEQAVNVAPQNSQALEGLARAYSRAGKPDQSIKLADQHPGLMASEEYRRLHSDIAANMIRDGMNAPNEAERYTLTDRAITMLNGQIADWSKDPDAQQDVVRARLDRIIALRNRNLMQEVIVQYHKLQDDHITIPPYVLSSVGDAYMYMHEPEQARDIYLEVLKSDPKNFEVRRQLVFAYGECNQYKEAYKVADDLAADQPSWIHEDGQSSPLPNARRLSAEILAGSVRGYAGETSESSVRILPVVAAAPNTVASREALGNLYQAHGWPRQALEQYQAAIGMAGGKDIGAESSEVGTLIQLQRYKEAEAKSQDLVQRMPESLAVQRAARDEEIHNMAELQVRAGYAFRPMTTQNVTGGEAYGIDTLIYSPPIGYNWRVFGGEFYTHQAEPDNEGSIGFSRSTIGAEYRNGPWVANLAPTYNHYNGTQRFGGEGDATYSINDQWTVAGAGELFSRDTPLRALNAGTTADFFGAHATWRQDEARQVRFGGDIMPFSDSNVRSGVDGDYAQQLYTAPNFKLDGLVSAAESQNSANSNRPYYNPSRDFIALVGPRATHTIYQRYTTMWQQSLSLTPGVYWEDHYGSDAAFRARYEQRLFLSNTFEAGAGVNFSRQSYDGNPENDVSLTFDLTDRF